MSESFGHNFLEVQNFWTVGLLVLQGVLRRSHSGLALTSSVKLPEHICTTFG